MCLAIPAKILTISGLDAYADFVGAKRKIRLDLLPSAKVNDYVLIHAGFAIAKISDAEAKISEDLLKEIIDNETNNNKNK